MNIYVAMYIDFVPNRDSRPCILLRESYREGGRVKKRTLANMSNWPKMVVDGLAALLRGGSVIESVENCFEIVRSLAHGHVAAVLGMLRRIKLDHIISAEPCRHLMLVVAMVVARVIEPRSKLATCRGFAAATLATSLGETLGIESANENDLYEAMDWLLERQNDIEGALARTHLKEGSLVLYDVSSSYFEGKCCPLAKFGHSRDKKKGKLQIIYGLICNSKGCPVAVEVFKGNTNDQSTLSTQVEKLRERFKLKHIIMVGDRGMITAARIDELREIPDVDWITSLRAPEIKGLVTAGSLQLSLFDKKDIAEITDPTYPDERLVVCKNPLLASDRARTREELLAKTEQKLNEIVQATSRPRNPLRGKDAIGLRVGKVVNKWKMQKHLILSITDKNFSYQRNDASIAAEKSLDGIYVIRASVDKAHFGTDDTVRAYKALHHVEQAFRSMKTVDLKIRPIYHYSEKRVRAHVFLCMLAYYVEWHMRQLLAPILFDDHDKATAQKLRSSIVGKARPSPEAQRKAALKKTNDHFPVHSFRTLLDDLASIVKNRVQPKLKDSPTFDKITQPTPLQQKTFDLLGVAL